jgi:hypothetical protein
MDRIVMLSRRGRDCTSDNPCIACRASTFRQGLMWRALTLGKWFTAGGRLRLKSAKNRVDLIQFRRCRLPGGRHALVDFGVLLIHKALICMSPPASPCCRFNQSKHSRHNSC